jgi:hypothetical protein
MGKLVKVLVTKDEAGEYSTAKEKYFNSEYISSLEVGDSNGCRFRYSPPEAGYARDIEGTTAASDIDADIES